MLLNEAPLYGTSKSSYLSLNHPTEDGKHGARMIVRHSAKIDDTKMGARSRCVESIFIENEKGERFLFPTKGLAPARAMAQHVNHGGRFEDPVGKKIIIDAIDYAHLAECSRHVYRNSSRLTEGALTIREACRREMCKKRKTFEKMYRPSGYVTEAARITEQANTLIEGDDTDATTPPEQIEEMRQTLAVEGIELSEGLFETVCRAIKEDMESSEAASTAISDDEQPVDEAVEVVAPTIRVLGHDVDAAAWQALKTGTIDLVHAVDDAATSGGKTTDLLNKLQQLIPAVRNESLMGLLSFIADVLPDETDPTKLRIMRSVANHAILAAGVEDGLAENNAVVREFAGWVKQHDTQRVVTEDDEELEEDDMGEADEDLQLSREDILLPGDNQGQNLKAQVTKPIVFDPATGREQEPDQGYIGRLRALSGMSAAKRGYRGW